MNIVDSSAWLEFFADGPNAGEFASVIMDLPNLRVPSVTLFEVFKRIRTQRSSEAGLYAVAQMRRGEVVDLDADLAVAAAELSAETGLPLADSIILATARSIEATLWTQDSDFKGLEDVEYRAHKKPKRRT